MIISPAQIRAARALLRFERQELADRAHVPVATIALVEEAGGNAQLTGTAIDDVRSALEHAGIEFIPDGVRHRQSLSPADAELYNDLRAISLRSAARLHGQELLTRADLYGADGTPA